MFTHPFGYGIIMGYYGPIWKEEVFEAYAKFCKAYGYRYFIYAPKADIFLRKKWEVLYTESHMAFLTRIREYFKARGIAFGIGFSPYGLRKLSPQTKPLLIKKLNQFNALKPDMVGVFFDDLTREDIHDELGQSQVEIAHFIADKSDARDLITVPTYYSEDRILTRILGPAPKQYFSQFAKIDRQFDIFWTGSHILSQGYTQESLTKVSEILGRKPVIWDNYPTNDPKYLQGFLRIAGLPHQYSKYANAAAGVAFNPMEQGCVSMIPLSTAKQSFASAGYNARESYLTNMRQLCGHALADAIDEDLNYFTLIGLDKTESSNLKRMREIYKRFTSPAEKKFTAEILALIDKYLSAKEKAASSGDNPANPYLT